MLLFFQIYMTKNEKMPKKQKVEVLITHVLLFLFETTSLKITNLTCRKYLLIVFFVKVSVRAFESLKQKSCRFEILLSSFSSLLAWILIFVSPMGRRL